MSVYDFLLNPDSLEFCRPFIKIKDSFKKIIITSNTPKPFYNEDGILIMSVYDFLLNPDSLEF